MVDRIFQTYESLWGDLMFIMHDPEVLWRVNEGRADWFESLDSTPRRRLLDIGCGNGYLDVILARRGHETVGVDAVETVIKKARGLVQSEPVTFVASDLRETDFDHNSFDAIFMFGVSGLMSIEADKRLFEKCNRWLNPGGYLLVDNDIHLARQETFTAEHPLGAIEWHWNSDPKTRLNQLIPQLHRSDGVVVGLRDPIEPARGDHPGLLRYIYPKTQLVDVLDEAGLSAVQVPHFSEFVFPDQQASSYMLKATPTKTS